MLLVVIVMLCRDWQLHHSGILTGQQSVNLQKIPTWEFQRIMLDVWIIHIDLPKARNPVTHTVAKDPLAKNAKTEGTIKFDIIVKGELRSG